MTPSDRQTLRATLHRAECPVYELAAPGMGALLAMPHGGRILGLFDDEDADNFLWVNPALERAEELKAMLAGEAWLHTGGDRTWVSPEIETHVRDAANAWATYVVPPTVDPGAYTISTDGQGLSLVNHARVTFYRQQVDCDLEIERAVRLIANPLRFELWFALLAGVTYAGYELTTTLRLPDASATPPRVSLWNIVVVPTTGWAILPTWSQPTVRDFFAPTGPGRLEVTPHAARFLIDGQAQHKIAVRAADAQGRLGYLRAVDVQHSTLIVRNCLVNPSGDYIDTPWNAPDELGYALQAYNDGGQLGAFGELEYHTPAIGGGSGVNSHRDVSQLWAFRGLTDQIQTIARRLLGEACLPDAGANIQS